MTEQEELDLIARLDEGLRKSYEDLLHRKAALGETMIVANADGMPIEVAATELLAKYNAEKEKS